MSWLNGKKTYLIAVAAGIAYGLHIAGIIDKGTLEAVLTALGIGAVASLRHAIGS